MNILFLSKRTGKLLTSLSVIVLLLTFHSSALAQFTTSDLEQLRTASSTKVVAYERIKLFDAWDKIRSHAPSLSTTTISIIDSGIDGNHPEFSGINFATPIRFQLLVSSQILHSPRDMVRKSRELLVQTMYSDVVGYSHLIVRR